MEEYICKSKVKEIRKHPVLKDIPIKDIEEQFYKCRDSKVEIVGVPFDKRRQKHVRKVNKRELEMRVFRDYFRLPKK